VVPELVVLGWGHAPQGECGKEAQDVLDCGGRTGGLECRADTTCPGWMSRALAQEALGCADSPETQYAEPAQDILIQGDILETRSAEPAPSFLAGCPFEPGQCEELE
jgi:hypothetical protein